MVVLDWTASGGGPGPVLPLSNDVTCVRHPYVTSISASISTSLAAHQVEETPVPAILSSDPFFPE